jgi:malate dehydrogenase (oxaloacetate-decarboxylating)(NADP+)
MSDKYDEQALKYHRDLPAGKIKVVPSKPLTTQQDLALAYSPGVAAACNLIVDDPLEVSSVTARGNLVAVITNGTAVLGLGAIGALASKPVMEGKGVLFKKFADIDVFDIEVEERDPDKFIDIVASLEPTFGGINLEDIRAPECFEIERRLKERMNIPVFHDDQHGTAIISAAAVINGLGIIGKRIDEVRLVCSGAGAAALSCLELLISLGLKRENILVCDSKGVVRIGAPGKYDERKATFAADTDITDLAGAIIGADIFLGLSVAGALKAEMVKTMAENPLIFALANPTPEILPEEALAVRPDAILATGRSDYPNQVNNVLCFPFLFRGALDVGASEINEEMKKACVSAIAELAKIEVTYEVRSAYGDEHLSFGREYLIPKPFDPRLILKIAPAVAKAAMDSGVASRPIEDFEAYEERLDRFVNRSGGIMKPVFATACQSPQGVVYAEGENLLVLQAVQEVVGEQLARPILVGRPEVIGERIKRLGLRIKPDQDFEIINPENDPRHSQYSQLLYELMERDGISPEEARTLTRTNNTLIAALTLKLGYADAMLCGVEGRFNAHLRHLLDIIGRAPGVSRCASVSAVMLEAGTFFICDTHVIPDPTAAQIAEIAILCSQEVQRFGIHPKVALLSYSNFGASGNESPVKMRKARKLIRELAPDLEVEGEMHADAALSEQIRSSLFPNSLLKNQANLLVMPNLDAANIAFNMFKVLGQGVTFGPIMVGLSRSAHVLTPSVSVRGLLNMTAVASAKARAYAMND